MRSTEPIPVFNLKERGKDALEIIKLEPAINDNAPLNNAHRDDNYLIIYQEYGVSKIMVDFKEVTIDGCCIFIILPGQIHYGISYHNVQAWFIAVDSSWINEEFRTVFTKVARGNMAISLEQASKVLLNDCLQILFKFYRGAVTFYHRQCLRSMLDVSLGVFASIYKINDPFSSKINLRIHVITNKFRNLLIINFRSLKKPSEYAQLLNITATYLNEVVKQSSGHSVSYWIQQEIMLEAKRMLFYTNSSVKEISYMLGYEDPTYFIRIFGKVAGISPVSFRQKYRV